MKSTFGLENVQAHQDHLQFLHHITSGLDKRQKTLPLMAYSCVMMHVMNSIFCLQQQTWLFKF